MKLNEPATQTQPLDFLGSFLSRQTGVPFRFEQPFQTRFNSKDEPLVVGIVGSVTWIETDKYRVGVIAADPEGDGMPNRESGNPAHIWPPAPAATLTIMLNIAIELECAHLGLKSESPKINESRNSWKGHREHYWSSMPEVGAEGFNLIAPDPNGFKPTQTPPTACREQGTEKHRAFRATASYAWAIEEDIRANSQNTPPTETISQKT